MPDSNQPHGDDAASERPSEMPASVAFMEMMRQAAARANRTAPVPTEPEPVRSRPSVPRSADPTLDSAAVSALPVGEAPIELPATAEKDAPTRTRQAPSTRAGDVRRVRRQRARSTRPTTFLGGVLRSVIIILVSAGLTATILTWFTPQGLIREGVRQELSAAIATSEFATSAPTYQPTPNWLKKIGIVSGHRGPQDDPGAVCQDAAGNIIPPTENEINFSVAERVVNLLRGMGYTADLLDEFDPRLNNYQAAALVSIHANTCQEWPGGEVVSGFLIAGPAARLTSRGNDELLVGCISDHYGAMTGLLRRQGVTADMSHYHNFREIDPRTPGAILELGFMLADRELLAQPDLLAQAVTNGILCFVDPPIAPTRPAPASMADQIGG